MNASVWPSGEMAGTIATADPPRRSPTQSEAAPVLAGRSAHPSRNVASPTPAIAASTTAREPVWLAAVATAGTAS